MELALIITAAALALAYIERQASVMHRKRQLRVRSEDRTNFRRGR